jgi:hypothetical protein
MIQFKQCYSLCRLDSGNNIVDFSQEKLVDALLVIVFTNLIVGIFLHKFFKT